MNTLATDRFKQVVTQSYQLVAQVTVTDVYGTTIMDSSSFQVAAGNIQCDASASIRRYITDLTIVDLTGSLVPNAAADMFSVVSGNQIKVSVGAIVDGVPLYLPQGVFQLEGAAVEDGPDGLTITLSAYDLARRVGRNRLLRPYQVAHGTNAVQAIKDILFQQAPWIVWKSTATTSFLIPAVAFDPDAEANPWDAARKIADAAGLEIFFDVNGQGVIQPIPDPYATGLTVATTFQEGVNSTLLRLRRASSNEQIFSVYVVHGENTDNIVPARGKAEDLNPLSPTYIYGPYGYVPDFKVDPMVYDDTMATASAQGWLNRTKGMTEVVEFDAVPNPALQEGDIVSVVRAKSKVNAQLVIDRMSIGLFASGGAMRVTTRQRRF